MKQAQEFAVSPLIKDIYAAASSSFYSESVPVLSTSKSAPVKGRVAYDTTSNSFEYADGSIWITKGGSVTQINTGTGLTGGPITGTGTISLANTGVGAGTYGSSTQIPVLTVNQQGQITAATTTVSTNVVSVPSSFYYFSGSDTVVPNGTPINWNATSYQNTGTIVGNVWLCGADGIYSISFSTVSTNGRGQFQINRFSDFVGYCEAGNDADLLAIPPSPLVIGTSTITIFLPMSAGDAIVVANISGQNVTVKGNSSGPATVLAIMKIA